MHQVHPGNTTVHGLQNQNFAFVNLLNESLPWNPFVKILPDILNAIWDKIFQYLLRQSS